MFRVMRSTIIFVLFIVVMVGIVFPVGALVEPHDSLLYFYSYADSVFTIEDPQGTHQQQLAPFTLSTLSDALQGPAWSASGRWFAWHGIEGQVFVSSRDGSQQAMLTSAWGNFVVSGWAPSQDLIAVLQTSDSGLGVGSFRFFVFEVNQQTPVFYRTIALDDFEAVGGLSPFFQWNIENDIVYLGNNYGDRDLAITKVTQTGVSQEFEIQDIPLLGYCKGYTLSPNGYIYDAQHQLMIGATERVAVAVEPNLIGLGFVDALWNPQGNAALILLTRDCTQATEFVLGLFLSAPARIEYVMSHVYNNVPFSEELWSSDGRYAWIVDTEGKVFVVDTLDGSYLEVNDRELEISGIPLVQWSGDTQFLFIQDSGILNKPVYVFEKNPNENNFALHTLLRNQNIYTLQHSPSGRYLASATGCTDGILAPCIYDLETGQINQLPVNSSHEASFIGEAQFKWSQDEQWILIGEFSQLSASLVRVASTSTPYSRELGYCWNTSVCYGWLPTLQ